MRIYRFRIVRPTSELVALQEHECSNDTTAATKARALADVHNRAQALCNGDNVEVWQGNRWVATIKDYSAHSGVSARVLP